MVCWNKQAPLAMQLLGHSAQWRLCCRDIRARGDVRARGESLGVSGTQGSEGQGGGVRLKPAARAWPRLSRRIHSRPEHPHRKAVGATKASRRGSTAQEQADNTVPADTALLGLPFDPERPPEMGGTANQQPWGVLLPSSPDGPRGAGGHC